MESPINELMVQKLEQLRTKLLDLSLANRLLNFKHSPQGRSFLRVINDTPHSFWERLRHHSLIFRSLPPLEDEPKDESEANFIQAWQTARLSDTQYQTDTQALENEIESTDQEEKMFVIERSLKDRIRQVLGLPSRHLLTTSLIEHAKRCKIDPAFDLPKVWPTEKFLPHQDIQLLLLPKAAEQQLSYVRDAAAQRLEESSVNILFCAFGFLQWYETIESNTPLYAPFYKKP